MIELALVFILDNGKEEGRLLVLISSDCFDDNNSL
jgi:hypothetical protein